jgi:predicted SAM-dependent methyltransferase
MRRIIKLVLRMTRTRNLAISFVEWWWRHRSSAALSSLISVKRRSGEPLRIQIGSGSNRLSGWLNTDLTKQGEYFLNASDLRVIPDGSVDVIYAEQIVEHLELHEAAGFLKQAFGKLKKRGIIRISTPDLQELASNYAERTDLNESLVRMMLDKGNNSHGDHASASLNVWFYSWGHKFIFDEPTLTDLMKASGFSNIKRFEVGKSDRPEFSDVEQHEIGSALDKITLVLQAQRE